MIRAVLFDVDGVLIDSFEANYTLCVELTTRLKLTVPTREDYKGMFHISLRGILEKLMKGKSEKEIQQAFDQGISIARSRYRHDLLTTPEKMEKTIRQLHKKYVLGIVTSRVRGGVFSVPKLKHIEKYFKTAVYFEDTVKHKPNPDPLLLAAKRLNLKPEECVYIGDSHSDKLASDAAGIKIIIYTKIKPTYQVSWTSDFSTIPQLANNG